MEKLVVNTPTTMLWGIATGAFGYGYRSWYVLRAEPKKRHIT